ncbi:hypothetical protein KCU91_g1742, partial [Aureobasidium melanogenum]
MSDQQATAGASMHDEQVINKHSDYKDAPANDQRAPGDTTTHPITHGSTSSHVNHAGDLPNDPVKTYTLMLEHFSKGDTEEGEKLAQELVLWGHYPEKVHARLFLAQGTQDALMHARLAYIDAAKAIAKYREDDNEKFKLLDLAYRILARVKTEESLGVIEEVDEEDDQVKGRGEVTQEIKEEDDQEVKEKDEPRFEEGGSGKKI